MNPQNLRRQRLYLNFVILPELASTMPPPSIRLARKPLDAGFRLALRAEEAWIRSVLTDFPSDAARLFPIEGCAERKPSQVTIPVSGCESPPNPKGYNRLRPDRQLVGD
jgi:hypothetical protein